MFTPVGIVVTSAEPHEMGSALSAAQSINGLAASLGIARPRSGLLRAPARGGLHNLLRASERSNLASTALLAIGFLLAFGLLRQV